MLHAPILKHRFNLCQALLVDKPGIGTQTQAMLNDTAKDKSAQRAKLAELAARQQKILAANIDRALKGHSPKVIAEKMEVTEQAVSGWRRTGQIANYQLLPLAAAVGWTVEELLREGGKAGDAKPPAPTLEPAQLQLLEDLDVIAPSRQSKILDQIRQAADEAREIADHVRTRGSKVPAAAAKVQPQTSALTLTYGDGNALQGALPLSTVRDPFTAEPDERESALYEKFGRSPK